MLSVDTPSFCKLCRSFLNAVQSYHVDGRADTAAGISCRSPEVQHRPREPEDFSPRSSHSPSRSMSLIRRAELESIFCGAYFADRIYMSGSHRCITEWSRSDSTPVLHGGCLGGRRLILRCSREAEELGGILRKDKSGFLCDPYRLPYCAVL